MGENMVRLLATLILTTAVVSSAAADTIELRSGGHLSGQVKDKGDYTVIRIDQELQVALPTSRVSRAVASSELVDYRKRAEAAGKDAERHYRLAIWCGKNVPGNTKLYKRLHMERAIEFDPDHSKARAWLGYTKQRGKWVLTSELMRDRGMVWRGGRWELPEAIAINDTQSTANTEAKRWIRDIKRLVSSVRGRNKQKSQEAFDALKSINDPAAALAVGLQLKNSRKGESQSRELRQLWVNLLGRFKTRDSVEALVLAGIQENDATIREAALNELVKFGYGSAVATYLPMLGSNNNDTVNRAARALQWFPDPELAMSYVNALVTEHKTVEAPGAGMQVGFGDRGNGGLAMGGKPKVKVREKQNPAVLALLREIETDVDYGYDEQAWLEHFAAKRGAYQGDLRRDP
jgi:hypothetical protein